MGDFPNSHGTFMPRIHKITKIRLGLEAILTITHHRCQTRPQPPQATENDSVNTILLYNDQKITYLEEGFGILSDLLAPVLVHVLFANVGTPLLNNILLDDISLVQYHENLGSGASGNERLERRG